MDVTLLDFINFQIFMKSTIYIMKNCLMEQIGLLGFIHKVYIIARVSISFLIRILLRNTKQLILHLNDDQFFCIHLLYVM